MAYSAVSIPGSTVPTIRAPASATNSTILLANGATVPKRHTSPTITDGQNLNLTRVFIATQDAGDFFYYLALNTLPKIWLSSTTRDLT